MELLPTYQYNFMIYIDYNLKALYNLLIEYALTLLQRMSYLVYTFSHHLPCHTEHRLRDPRLGIRMKGSVFLLLDTFHFFSPQGNGD